MRHCRRGTVQTDTSADFRNTCKDLANALWKHINDVDMGVPHSLCLRLLRADILRDLGQHDVDAVLSLAHTSPPFGSWTSAPACKDDWVDPVDEICVNPEDSLDWEGQVGGSGRIH